MDPTERIIRQIEGRPVDRIPTFSASLDDWPVQQVLGRPLVLAKTIFMNPVSRFITDHWGRHLKKVLADPFIAGGFRKRIEAAVELGFDADWVTYEATIMVWDSKTLAKTVGCFMDWIDDGYGNMYFMYRGPAIPTPEAYEAWPYHQDIDELSHMAHTFFKDAQKRYGDKICLMGDVASGAFEILVQIMGFQSMAVNIRKRTDYLKKLLAYNERYVMNTHMAMMDAGVKVILKGDDFSYKTGPMLNPEVIDELFGPIYMKLCKAVHDRGGKILIHSCGDNTKIFDLFIKWGFDGGHAYENTSTVDIAHEKKVHGDRFTIVGGVGIDYILTPRSTPEEVRTEVRRLIKLCGPGGRFIIGPVHDHPDMDVSKIKVMLETVWEEGKYPIGG
jgi:hypothetical protein